MHRSPVISEAISKIGYDPAGKILEVEFHEGRIYRYFQVSPSEYHPFMSTSSHGEYFLDHICGKYTYRRVK